MKNTLEGINSRLNDTEDWISEVEGRVVEITAIEQRTAKKKKKKKKNEKNKQETSGRASESLIFMLQGSQKTPIRGR